MSARLLEQVDLTSPPPGQRRRAAFESLCIVSSMLLAVIAGVIGVWLGSKAAITANFRRELMGLAETAATLVNSSLHDKIRQPGQLNGPEYIQAVTPLRRMRSAVPDIHYLYTLVRDGQDVRFVLDAADPESRTPAGSPDQSGVWEVYSHDSPALQVVLGSPDRGGEVTADEQPTSDEWGTFMTGWAPLVTAEGRQIGAVGVDVDASHYLERLRQARNRLLLGLLPAAALSVVFGCMFYRVRLRGLIDAHTAYSNEQTARLAAEALAKAAQQDRLTQLATRTVFIEALEAAMLRVSRRQQMWVAVLFLDFDRFKLLNDSLGHEAGDDLLRSISTRLREALLAHDTGGAGSDRSVVCRFGGDEFLVLVNNLRAPDEAVALSADLLARLAQPYTVFGADVHSTASIGIVTSDTGRQSAAEMIRNADVAMYEAKRSGRGCSVVFDASMHARLERQLILESGLRRAIGTEQLYLEYQPIVDLNSGRRLYVEALLRWRHPAMGTITPGEFIPIAEDSRLIIEVGHWVRRAACQRMAAWLREAPTVAPAMVSVNVSRAELGLGQAFLEQVKSDLQWSGLPPSCLQLEITEREVMRDPPAALSLLRQLRALGVQLAMDDFGTGTSSLSLLRDFPFHTVKIDRSFLQDLYTSREVQAIIQATIHLIENLGMMSVAEGVEDAVQVPMLQSLGCQGAQGYYFGRPMNADSVVLPEQRPSISEPSGDRDHQAAPPAQSAIR
jgi:diguanylate cyclase (GGDEF)-like protein